jgi:hypothetical protein
MFDNDFSIGMKIIEYFSSNDKHMKHNICKMISYYVPYGQQYYMFTLSGDNRLFIQFNWHSGNKKQIVSMEKI